MKTMQTATRLAPYAKQLAENEYAQENLRRGAESLRAAYKRSQKRRVKNAKDEKLHHQLESALAQLSEGTRALAGKRQKPKPRWPKRLAAVGLVGAAAAGVALAAGDEIKSALGMGGEQEQGA
ncbi:MAG TPA: hypothetical protein VGV34_07225 [Solirubrobacterales bacterium]|nr:hypothetical protein [Solirubrobacterales bacterium]